MTEIRRIDPQKQRGRRRSKTLRAPRPNVGIEQAYRAALERWVKAMNASVLYWVRAKFKANEPEVLAIDELPATAMRREVRKLSRRWQKNINDAAPKLADYFTTEMAARSDAQLARILKDGGFSVKFTQTRAQRDIVNATLTQNVSLIKSIPQQYLKDVEGAVMRSIQTGRDLHQLTGDIEKIYGVTRRRAELIARDQNNKATSAMHKARFLELKITEAIWLHSHAGKKPRPTHVKMHGKKYDVAKGMYDPDPRVRAYIQPGELPNCGCTPKPVIPGL